MRLRPLSHCAARYDFGVMGVCDEGSLADLAVKSAFRNEYEVLPMGPGLLARVRLADNRSCTRCTPHGTAGYLVPVASAANTRMVMRPYDTGLTVDRCD